MHRRRGISALRSTRVSGALGMITRTGCLSLRVVVAVLTSIHASLPALAQSELGKITPGDADAEDQFGFSVSMSGDSVVVGAIRSGPAKFSRSGAAYVFEKHGARWMEQAKLTAHDAEEGDRFGVSVCIRGTYAIVGASRDGDAGAFSGSAYVFERSGGQWTERAKLTAADAGAGDMFGFAVAIAGNYAVVGAYRDDAGGRESGSAYVFVREGRRWVQRAKLRPSNTAPEQWFGRSVAISEDRIAVGATGVDHAGEDAGAVYVFKREEGSAKPAQRPQREDVDQIKRDGPGGRGNWIEEAMLTASDGSAGDRFGRSVAMCGDDIIVGAFFDDGVGADSGSAYVFHRRDGAWHQQAKFTAANAAADDLFGISVGISGDYAVVGAMRQDQAGTDAGAAYFFRRVGPDGSRKWTQPFRVTSSDAGQQDWFGFSVAIDGIYTVVGAIRDDDHGFDSGSADVYSVITVAP